MVFVSLTIRVQNWSWWWGWWQLLADCQGKWSAMR